MLTKNCYTELNQPNLEKILSVIRNGGIFIYPTETVWALGCIALNKSSVDKIYQLKKRDKSKPLICLIDDFESISKYAILPESKIATKLKLHNHPTVIYQKTKPKQITKIPQTMVPKWSQKAPRNFLEHHGNRPQGGKGRPKAPKTTYDRTENPQKYRCNCRRANGTPAITIQ